MLLDVARGGKSACKRELFFDPTYRVTPVPFKQSLSSLLTMTMWLTKTTRNHIQVKVDRKSEIERPT